MQVKKLFQSQNKVFLTWIATSILIFLIPIILGEFVYYNSISIIKSEVENVHQASLQQIKILVDGKMEELKKIGNNLSIDSKVKLLAYSKNFYSPKNLYTMNEIQNDLKKYIVSNNFIENIYLYFNGSKCLLTGSGIYEGDEIKSFVEDNFMTGMEDWGNQINAVNQGNIRIYKKEYNTGTKNVIILFQSISARINSKSPEVTLMAVINNEKLEGVLSSLGASSKANIFIIDSRNEYSELNGDNILLPSVNYSSLRSTNSIFNLEYKNGSATIIHTGSAVTNLEYILSMPSSVFAYKVRYIKMIIYFYIGACLFLGLIMIYLITKRNYYPLMRLTQISSKNVSVKNPGKNEYNVIENAINSLVHDKESAEKRIKRQDIPLRKNFLLRILKGRINKASMGDLSKLYNIRFDSDDFIVMVFDVENLGRISAEDCGKLENENEELIGFIIQNITMELAGDNYLIYFTDIDGLNIFLINCKTGLADSEDLKFSQDHIAEAAKKAINLIKEHFDIGLSAAVSDIKAGFDQIPSAYTEVMEIIEYKRLMEKSNVVIKYGSIEKNSQDELENINTMKSEIEFMNYLLDNDFKNASLILDNIMEFYLPPNATNFQIIKCRMFGLINIMMNALGEFKSKADVDYFSELDPMKRMINAKSGTELKNQIREIFKSIIDYCSNKESGETPDKVDEIIDFINHHYFDQNLNASTIAMQYGMNVSYLCRIFKKRTETGILDYIHKCRIENAKSMLSTGLNITEISEKVGYNSSLAMIRTFKKYEGVTPGKYREKFKL